VGCALGALKSSLHFFILLERVLSDGL